MNAKYKQFPKNKKVDQSELLMKKMMGKLKNLGETKFQIKGTKFSIEKLPPMKGFRVAEQIRVNLAESADKLDVKDGSDEGNAALFFKAILGLSPDFIDSLMGKMFDCIQFTGKDTGTEKGWQTLSGSEDSAFMNFEVINIYEVLWRALFVNFSGSFSEISSAFPGVGQILTQLKAKT